MAVMIYLALIVISLVFYYFCRAMIRPRNFPPGPFNYPLLGGIPYIGENFLKGIQQMHEKYGKIFGFNLGMDHVVVVADFDLYKEISNRDEFCYRPDFGPIFDARQLEGQGDSMAGVMFANGHEWQELRRFILKNLRDFGFGKTSMEGLIFEEVEKTIDFLQQDVGKPVSLKNRLNIPIINALWHILIGEKFDYNNLRLKEIVCKLDLMMTSVNFVGILNVLPWLKHFFPNLTGYNTVNLAQKEVLDMVKKSCDEHTSTFQKDAMRDFLDVYIKQMSLDPDIVDQSFHGARGRQHLFTSLNDLFIGGSETTVNTLNWTLYHMAKNPERQQRLQEEINKVVGKDRFPSLDDRPKMPYLEAIVQEIHRTSSLGYIGIPRMAAEDTTLAGYNIPKGSQVFCFLYAIMHDPEYWTDPDEFIPERFIDEEGNLKMDPRNIPFGLGKRMCLGKSLAQNELFLFVGALFQKFSFSLPPETINRKMEPTVGFVLGCPDYKIVIHNRESKT